jgi:hypothetical protein
MKLRTARLVRIIAGFLTTVAMLIVAAGYTSGLPLPTLVAASISGTGAAAVLLWATHVQARLTQNGDDQ